MRLSNLLISPLLMACATGVQSSQQPPSAPRAVVVAAEGNAAKAVQHQDTAETDGGYARPATATKPATDVKEESERKDREIAVQERTANLTFLLVLVGVGTILMMGWQSYETRRSAKAASKSADAASAAIVLTHRPRLTVRQFGFDGLITFDDSPPHVLNGACYLANNGATPASVALVNATFFVGDMLPLLNPCTGHPAVAPKVIQPGEMVLLSFLPFSISKHDERGVLTGRLRLYAIGNIVYSDDRQNVKRMGFARSWNKQTGRFEIETDADYEYSD
jgi:hypothetical protein